MRNSMIENSWEGKMLYKTVTALLMLLSGVALAQGGCSGLYGFAQGACIAEQQRLQQQQQMLLQQQYQQQQLEQQRFQQQQQILQQQQIENQRLQNEILKKKLEQEQAAAQQTPQTAQPDYSKTPEFQAWLSANQWFGKDRAKTEYALLYAKQLRQDHPELLGKPFFDNVSAKVMETFGGK